MTLRRAREAMEMGWHVAVIAVPLLATRRPRLRALAVLALAVGAVYHGVAAWRSHQRGEW